MIFIELYWWCFNDFWAFLTRLWKLTLLTFINAVFINIILIYIKTLYCIFNSVPSKGWGKARKHFIILHSNSHIELENIEVSENNIRDFLNVAKKYDIDFSLKRDNTKEPPVYHVFFSASRTDDFKRAFTEYANSKQLSESKPERGEFSRDNLKKEAAEVSKQQKRDKIRQRSREVSHWWRYLPGNSKE